MLINKIDTLKDILGGVQNEMFWSTWKPFVRQAEIDYLIPAIGEELYEELNTLVNQTTDEITGTPTQKSLIERLRIALGYYTDMESLLSMLLVKGDGGIAVASPPNMQAPGKWMIIAKMAESRDKADRGMEGALQYLEQKKTSFSVWVSSNNYTVSHGLFLSSAVEYTDYFPPIRGSRRLYLSLRGYIEKSERERIQPMLGLAFFNHLKAKLIAQNAVWDEAEKVILPMIRTIVANDAFARAVPYLNLNNEFRLVSETDGVKNEDILTNDRLTAIKADTEKEVKGEITKLKNYLDENTSYGLRALLLFPTLCTKSIKDFSNAHK